MQRKIASFRQDQQGDWVATLECGHAQHVRHNPPFQERAWVLTSEGRQSFVGVAIECKDCQIEKRPPPTRETG
ncbi:MAG: GNAT family acetyltransferase [Chloroflexi bacterium UTCFX4]|nr:MAG: GNAT family acetyltransferase [Chloroflexi bacterium UTCFX4]